jgi:hypothetical protein
MLSIRSVIDARFNLEPKGAASRRFFSIPVALHSFYYSILIDTAAQDDPVEST